jgi:hypothetical protein
MTLDELIAKHRDAYVDLFTRKVMDAIEELERNVGYQKQRSTLSTPLLSKSRTRQYKRGPRMAQITEAQKTIPAFLHYVCRCGHAEDNPSELYPDAHTCFICGDVLRLETQLDRQQRLILRAIHDRLTEAEQASNTERAEPKTVETLTESQSI